MTKLYDRRWSLTLGTLDVSDLDIDFKVTKSLKYEPNTCEILVYNLGEKSREQLATVKKLQVRLEAGYKDELSQLYLGEVRSAFSYYSGADVITKVSSGDSEKEISASHLSVPIGAKTPIDVALQAIAKKLGVNLGNLQEASQALVGKGYKSPYPKGGVLEGNVARELTDICRAANLEWSVQDGKLFFLDKDATMRGLALKMSSDTGLVGSPTIDNKGEVDATCLLIPDMRPGVAVEFDTFSLKGRYKVTHCEYTGSTFDTTWYVKFHAKKR